MIQIVTCHMGELHDSERPDRSPGRSTSGAGKRSEVVATDPNAPWRRVRKASRARAPNSPWLGEGRDTRTAQPDEEVREDLGWVGVNAEGEVFCAPWAVPLSDHGSAPPPGVWVSCKAEKSYVYDLVYV
jgi:hypothetical protein